MPLIQWIMQNLNNARVEGVVAGGTADLAVVTNIFPLGGVVVGGEAAVTLIPADYTVSGGVVGGGSADESVVIVGLGGVVVSGEAELTNAVIEFGSGGVVVGGDSDSTVTINHIYTEVGSSEGVVVGGSATESVGQIEVCDKYLLPNHPKPSTANYSPQNIAPLIDFFTPLVAGVLGQNIDHCQVVFRYENNTPCKPEDDIFVPYPTCIGQNYTPPGPNPCSLAGSKSDELKKYEEYAKKSDRLKKYMQESPAKIEYFNDLCFS